MTLLLRLPWLVSSLTILLVVAGLIVVAFTSDGDSRDVAMDVASWIVLAGFTLSGLLPLWQPAENVIVRVLFRLRPPLPQEQQRLDGPWGAVARRAGIGPHEYSLWVEDTDGVNALAGAGHTVGITRFALANLRPDHLEAVLAHELGHHLGGHAWAQMMVFWYSLPARLALRLAGLFTRLLAWAYGVVVAAVAVFAPRHLGVTALVGCVAVPVALFCVLPLVLPLLPLALAPPIEAWFRRRSELYADRVAAELGYAPALADLFQRLHAQGGDDDYPATGTIARLTTTHPPLYARIQQLQPLLR